MAVERKDLAEFLRFASKLPVDQQLELITKLSLQLTGKKISKEKVKTWMDMAGTGAGIWKDSDAQDYVRQERASWGD